MSTFLTFSTYQAMFLKEKENGKGYINLQMGFFSKSGFHKLSNMFYIILQIIVIFLVKILLQI